MVLHEIDPETIKMTLKVDLKNVERHFFGPLHWRKHLAVVLIKAACILLCSDLKFINDTKI